MAASARQLRTGDDAGARRLGIPAERSNYGFYAEPVERAVIGGVATNMVSGSASFNLVFPNDLEALGFPTGQDTMTALHSFPVKSWVPLIDLAEKPTGYGWLLMPLLSAFVTKGDPSDIDETDEPSAALVVPGLSSVSRPETLPEAAAAARLRELSGLETERLAELLGVTRTAFYGWLGGAKPRGTRRDHLLQVLHVLEEVSSRHGSPREVAAWLMFPSAVSARVPFDLLKGHQYDLCRSLLTRKARPPLASRARRRLEGSELREALDRATARPASDDYEDQPPDE